MNIELYIIIALLSLALLAYIAIFNSLIGARQKVKEAWSGIDVQLKRRYELIPNLVRSVEAYAKHESSIFESVTEARTCAMSVSPEQIADKSRAEDQISVSLKSLLAIAEDYPDLKANKNYLTLQAQLTETEDQIASARRIYNSNAAVLNTKVDSFPSNIIASLHLIKKAEYFNFNEADKS